MSSYLPSETEGQGDQSDPRRVLGCRLAGGVSGFGGGEKARSVGTRKHPLRIQESQASCNMLVTEYCITMEACEVSNHRPDEERC